MRPVQNIIVAIYLASLYNASFFLTYADTIPAHKSLRRLQGGGEMGGQGQAPQQGPEQGGQPQQQGPEQGGQPQQQQGPEGQQGQAPEGQAQQGQAQQGQAQQGQAQQGQAQQGQAQQQGPEGQQGQGQQAQQQGPEQQQQQQQQQQGPEQQQQQQQQQSQQQQQQNQKTQKNQQNQQQQQQQQQQPQQQQSTYYNYQNQQGSSSTTSTDTTQVVSSDTDTSSSAAQVQPASYSSATSKTSYNNDIHMGVVVGCSVGVAAVVIGLVFVVFRVSAVGNGLFGSDGLAVAPTGKTGRGMDDSADQEVDFTAHSRVALTDVRFQDSPVDVSTRDLSSHAARHGLNEPTAKGAGNSAPVRYSSPPNVYYPKTKREKTTID
eukprot:gene6558-13262_t